MTAHEYFIENYIKTKQPDGSFASIKLTDTEKDILKFMEDAIKTGKHPLIIKGRTRPRIGLLEKHLQEKMIEELKQERSVATAANSLTKS
jgi:hypothetical protein